ncbi:hypothetical protein J2S55_006239 [Streptosporangium brasiliense]|uniref:Uncharacterized protein n=1 Tax=Streptosporangium brasiliense TaxID=47480 RepID=A0ABT9RCJ0_9ACTN|nr:hypothetical protein [Streptosporangium brasiliense]
MPGDSVAVAGSPSEVDAPRVGVPPVIRARAGHGWHAGQVEGFWRAAGGPDRLLVAVPARRTGAHPASGAVRVRSGVPATAQTGRVRAA